MTREEIEFIYFEKEQYSEVRKKLALQSPVYARMFCFAEHIVNIMQKREDRQYRNGFFAGWNAGMICDEDVLKMVQERANND